MDTKNTYLSFKPSNFLKEIYIRLNGSSFMLNAKSNAFFHSFGYIYTNVRKIACLINFYRETFAWLWWLDKCWWQDKAIVRANWLGSNIVVYMYKLETGFLYNYLFRAFRWGGIVFHQTERILMMHSNIRPISIVPSIVLTNLQEV